MGFGILQEIFMETYQRPLIVDNEIQAGTKSRLRVVYPLGLPGFHGCGFAAVAGAGITFLQNAKAHYPCPARMGDTQKVH